MVGQYLIFLLLFILRSHKEIISVFLSRNPLLKIKPKDLLGLFLKQPCRAQVSLTNKKIFLHLRDIADLTSLLEIFLHRVYPLRATKKGLLIWDVGSHSGFFALYACLRLPKAKVSCFEPDPDNFKNSLLNLRLNPRLAKRIRVSNFGFSNQTMIGKLYQYPFSLHQSCYRLYQPTTTIKVRLESFRNYLSKTEAKIDLLKIDTEGAEYSILYPLKKRDFEKIGQIFLEIHNLDKTSKNEKTLIAFLKKFYQKTKQRNNLYYFTN